MSLVQHFASIVELFAQPMFVASLDGAIWLENESLRSTFGAADTVAGVVGNAFNRESWNSMTNGEAHFECIVSQPMADGRAKSGDGDARWWRLRCNRGESGATSIVLGQFEDVTEVFEREQTLTNKAHRDHLTGLLNRRGLHHQWRTQVTAESVCVLYVDIDGLKAINDHHGHRAGDLALQLAAGRLRDAARPTDLIARVGGDEFVIVAPGVDRPDDAFAIARRLHGALCGPFAFDDATLELRASFGATVRSRADGLSAAMEVADREMYRNKRPAERRSTQSLGSA